VIRQAAAQVLKRMAVLRRRKCKREKVCRESCYEMSLGKIQKPGIGKVGGGVKRWSDGLGGEII
jgi:hypothetical protein